MIRRQQLSGVSGRPRVWLGGRIVHRMIMHGNYRAEPMSSCATLQRVAFVLLTLCLVSITSAQPRDLDITFSSAGQLELYGTLLLPDAEGPHPAVLLLPGSGPTDRDGNQHPHFVTDLLKEIAEGLAREGVASLRFDKRATRRYAAHWPRQPEQLDEFFSWDNFVGDAEAAITFLHAREEIDASRIAIAGHSEGGLIALELGKRLAGTPREPVGLMLLATAGRTLDVVVREQIEASLVRAAAGPEHSRSLLAHTDAAIAAIKAREPLPADLPRQLHSLFNPTVLSLLHSYFTIDPADLAKSFNGPVLIVQGEQDLQVSAERDMSRLKAALQERTMGRLTVAVIPDASHNFKSLAKDAQGFRGPVHVKAMHAILEWAGANLATTDESAGD